MAEGAGSGDHRAGLLPRILELRPASMAPMATLSLLQEVIAIYYHQLLPETDPLLLHSR